MVASGTFCLAIETSNPESPGGASVALGLMEPSGLRVLAVAPLLQGPRHDDDLLPAIDRLVERCGVRAGTIGRVVVSIGPGGFTALRIAVAAGKMIAEGVGARCVAVPSALVAAAGASVPPGARRLAVALAGKSDSAVVCTLGSDDDALSASRACLSARVLHAPDVAGLGADVLLADEHLPGPLRQAAQAARLPVVELRFDAGALLAVSMDLPDIDPVELVPFYGREPEAVALWRARLGKG